jgi:hypothetical protein
MDQLLEFYFFPRIVIIERSPGIDMQHTQQATKMEIERSTDPKAPITGGALERHFAVSEVAAFWGLSRDAVRRLFCKEPGVLVLGNRSRKGKRRYATLRTPQSVLDRVYRRYLFD